MTREEKRLKKNGIAFYRKKQYVLTAIFHQGESKRDDY